MPKYDPKRKDEPGYLDWLKSWNVVPPGEGAAEAEAKTATATKTAETEPSEYDTWTVDELKEELGDRDLSQDGNKADLIARLLKDDDENAEE